jgi:hypothetical protein
MEVRAFVSVSPLRITGRLPRHPLNGRNVTVAADVTPGRLRNLFHMLTLYRRHSKAKCKYTARTEKRCSCPIWVTGTIRGQTISPGRQPLNTRMWRDAEREIERWQQDPENRRVEERESTAIEDAKDKYLVSC